MATFKLKSDLPQSTQAELDRVLAIDSAQRTSVEADFLVSLAPYLSNEAVSRNASGEIVLAQGASLPAGASGFAIGARFVVVGDVVNISAENVGTVEEAVWLSTTKASSAPLENVQAELTTELTGSDNDLVFTAVPLGADGNLISVEYLDPADNSIELAVAVVGNKITVTLETDSEGAIASTSADIVTAIEADEDASALVTVADSGSDDGTGVVTAMSQSFLIGGVTESGVGYATKGSLFQDLDTPALYINMADEEDPDWQSFD